jgi:DNA-binding XRE family transcriptional regulator
MDKKEISGIRFYLEKTQSQMAILLGVSLKAIQSFEQGWRKIPTHIERQTLFLLAMKKSPREKPKPCWETLKCPLVTRRNCPAWEFRAGHLCWFINGTICQGRIRQSWRNKMEICRRCVVFQDMIPFLSVTTEDLTSQGTQ